MIEKLIEEQEKELARHKALLDDEISTLERFIASLSKTDFKEDPVYDVSKSTQVDTVVSTMSAISKTIAKHEMNVHKHEEIIEGLKQAQESI